VSLTAENREQTYKAFEGATYAFAVTNYWEHLKKDKEIADGKVLVDAAKHAKVKRLIWSGLADCAGISGGKYHVDLFDSKAEVTEYARDTGVPFVNVTSGYYMANFLGPSRPKKQDDGSYVMFGVGAPDSLNMLVDASHDFGLWVRFAIESPEVVDGSEVNAFGECISLGEIAKQLGEVTGKNISYVQITEKQYIDGAVAEGLSEPVAKAVAEMHLFIAEFGPFGRKGTEVDYRKKLARAPRTMAEFSKATDWSKVLN